MRKMQKITRCLTAAAVMFSIILGSLAFAPQNALAQDIAPPAPEILDDDKTAYAYEDDYGDEDDDASVEDNVIAFNAISELDIMFATNNLPVQQALNNPRPFVFNPISTLETHWNFHDRYAIAGQVSALTNPHRAAEVVIPGHQLPSNGHLSLTLTGWGNTPWAPMFGETGGTANIASRARMATTNPWNFYFANSDLETSLPIYGAFFRMNATTIVYTGQRQITNAQGAILQVAEMPFMATLHGQTIEITAHPNFVNQLNTTLRIPVIAGTNAADQRNMPTLTLGGVNYDVVVPFVIGGQGTGQTPQGGAAYGNVASVRFQEVVPRSVWTVHNLTFTLVDASGNVHPYATIRNVYFEPRVGNVPGPVATNMPHRVSGNFINANPTSSSGFLHADTGSTFGYAGVSFGSEGRSVNIFGLSLDTSNEMVWRNGVVILDAHFGITTQAGFSGPVYISLTNLGQPLDNLGLRQPLPVHVANVRPGITVETETTVLEIGFDIADVADIIIRETIPGDFREGGNIEISLQEFGLEFTYISQASIQVGGAPNSQDRAMAEISQASTGGEIHIDILRATQGDIPSYIHLTGLQAKVGENVSQRAYRLPFFNVTPVYSVYGTISSQFHSTPLQIGFQEVILTDITFRETQVGGFPTGSSFSQAIREIDGVDLVFDAFHNSNVQIYAGGASSPENRVVAQINNLHTHQRFVSDRIQINIVRGTVGNVPSYIRVTGLHMINRNALRSLNELIVRGTSVLNNESGRNFNHGLESWMPDYRRYGHDAIRMPNYVFITASTRPSIYVIQQTLFAFGEPLERWVEIFTQNLTSGQYQARFEFTNIPSEWQHSHFPVTPHGFTRVGDTNMFEGVIDISDHWNWLVLDYDGTTSIPADQMWEWGFEFSVLLNGQWLSDYSSIGITSRPIMMMGDQNGIAVAGSYGRASFPLTFRNMADGQYDIWVHEWDAVLGMVDVAIPGAQFPSSIIVTNNAAMLYIDIDSTARAGDWFFCVDIYLDIEGHEWPWLMFAPSWLTIDEAIVLPPPNDGIDDWNDNDDSGGTTPPPTTTPQQNFNPWAPGNVQNEVARQLRAGADVVVLDISHDAPAQSNRYILAVSMDVLDMLLAADADLVVVSGDVSIALSREHLEELRGFDRQGNSDLTIRIEPRDDAGSALISIRQGQGGNARYFGGFENPLPVSVYLGELDVSNYHRMVATDANQRRIGGRFDNRTGIFNFEASRLGEFAVVYAEDLIRLTINLDLPNIEDLAGNASAQTMDVLPIIYNGRTLLPVRFMAYALGAQIGWTDATETDPMAISLTLDSQTLTFNIGEITEGLEAIGMDVPAQLIDGRTMVPLRFISEFFGAVVDWNEGVRRVEVLR